MKAIELARRIGVSKSLLSEYEHGTARVPASRLWDIAQVLDVPIGNLFEEDEPQPVSVEE